MLEELWAEAIDPSDPLYKIRQQGWEHFQKLGFPNRKKEAFRYVRRFPSIPNPSKPFFSGVKAEGIVFENGFFFPELSLLPSSIVCLPLREALRPYGLFLQSRLAKRGESDPFAALNGAFHGEGAFLYVPAKETLSLRLIQRGEKMGWASSRIHIYLGENARLRLEEISEGEKGFQTPYLDITQEKGSSFFLLDRSIASFKTIRASLKKDAHFTMVALSKIFRTSLEVDLLEENSETFLYGLSDLDGEEERHFHVKVEHKAPYTRSKQHFKSVLRGASLYSFEGKIYVCKEADKTEGYQLNNNLILSDEAKAFAKPNLEIFADDVKASHGSTTGRLDPEALFYLRTRGLSLNEAKEHLVRGFCREIIDHAR